MAEEILYHNKSLFEKCDILLPVPSTFMKRFFRKYNPSALICIYIISLLRKRGNEPAYLPFLLKRRGFRKSQVYLSKKNRLENLEKVFYIKKGKEFLSGLNVIVIDDVITTGATARAIGSEILKYNPLSLSFLTFAKTLLR
jgi:predicted amidophosphoribosyltransferase